MSYTGGTFSQLERESTSVPDWLLGNVMRNASVHQEDRVQQLVPVRLVCYDPVYGGTADGSLVTPPQRGFLVLPYTFITLTPLQNKKKQNTMSRTHHFSGLLNTNINMHSQPILFYNVKYFRVKRTIVDCIH